MAKAQFHKNQRVYVKPVGTWALIERVVPHWAKGLDEPLRIFYDVGLGREFGAEELQSEEPTNGTKKKTSAEHWRVVRGRNKWQSTDDCARHPHPGTYPIVMTGETEWGGWRVPGAEYDLDPYRIEHQAELIMRAPLFMKLLEEFLQLADQEPENLSDDMTKLVQVTRRILSEVSD